MNSLSMNQKTAFLIVALVSLALGGPLRAFETGNQAGKKKGVDAPKKAPEKAPATWALVNSSGKLQVVLASEVKTLKADATKAYKEELTSWTASRQQAKKDKEEFTDPRPKKPTLKVISAKFATKEAAEKRKTDLENKAKKKDAKKGGAKKGSAKKGSGKKDEKDN